MASVKKTKGPQFERMDHLSVVSMSADEARAFFGMPDAHVIDGGPPTDPERYKDGARTWLVYPERPRPRLVRS